VLLGVWLGTLQFMLDQGKNADWFNSRMIASLAALTAAAFAAWLIWGCTDPHPAVDMAFDHLAQTGPYTIGHSTDAPDGKPEISFGLTRHILDQRLVISADGPICLDDQTSPKPFGSSDLLLNKKTTVAYAPQHSSSVAVTMYF